MSTIKIGEIRSNGSDLFFDAESYMDELSGDSDLYIKGGVNPLVVTAITTLIVQTLAFSYNVGRNYTR